MPQTLLGSLALAYQPLWGKSRELTGIRLSVTPVPGGFVDGPHLLQVLRNFWPHKNAALIVSPTDPELMCTLLEKAPDYSPHIEIANDLLEYPEVVALVRAAHGRGLKMIWRGPNNWEPAPDLAPCFQQYLLCMDEQDTLDALRCTRAHGGSPNPFEAAPESPVMAGHIYEGIPSRELVTHCLDQRKVAALMGWPTDEVLHSYRFAPMQPGGRALQRVINAVSADASLEVIEAIIEEDPVLAYRLLVHVNSAAMALRSGIDSLRRALMMMGYTALKNWCLQMLPHANEDRDINPIRTANVLRANLAETLLDAGGEAEMRGEIHMCGLFSQLELFLNDPLPDLLSRIPISERVLEAVCADAGPYAPYLQVAVAMESTSAEQLPALCQGFDMDLDDVNRALLRTLGAMPIKAA